MAAVAASSGQSAQFMAIAAIAEAGDNIVTTSYLYGEFWSKGLRRWDPALIISCA